jgi:hypothetical protein
MSRSSEAGRRSGLTIAAAALAAMLMVAPGRSCRRH